MADLQNRNLDDNIGSAAQDSPSPPEGGKKGKKKKKSKGCGFFLLMLLLIAGVAAGMQAVGAADFRPWVYRVVPRIPLAGGALQRWLRIPERYAMTADELRRLELHEWELEIAAQVRSMDMRARSMDVVSSDLAAKEAELAVRLAEVAARLSALSDDMRGNPNGDLTDAQRAEIAETIRTFEEMSPKNAAAILEKLNATLAVAVMDGLPEENRAKILGRMEAATAARLTERLADLQKRRR